MHHNVDCYFIPETLLKGNEILKIIEHAFFAHSLDNHTSSRSEKGVAIILSPLWFKFYELAGSLSPKCAFCDNNDANGG